MKKLNRCEQCGKQAPTKWVQVSYTWSCDPSYEEACEDCVLTVEEDAQCDEEIVVKVRD